MMKKLVAILPLILLVTLVFSAMPMGVAYASPRLVSSFSKTYRTTTTSTDFHLAIGLAAAVHIPEREVWPGGPVMPARWDIDWQIARAPTYKIFNHETPGAFLFEDIPFNASSKGQTYTISSVDDDPDFDDFAAFLTNGTDDNIWDAWIWPKHPTNNAGGIRCAGGPRGFHFESDVFPGTDVGTDYPGWVVQSVSLTFDDITTSNLMIDYTVDITYGPMGAGNGGNPGWLEGWGKRVGFTIDSDDIDAELTDFPILIHLSTSSGINSGDVSFVFDELESDANRKKIAVTEGDGETQCYVEIEKWDDANEQAWLWAKVPTVASGADTILYLYYDKDHADNDAYVGDIGSTPGENVWDSDFVAVYHMADETTSTILDSTSYDNDGTKGAANEPPEIAYQIDGGQDFESTDSNYITCGSDASVKISPAITLEAWFHPESIQTNAPVVGRWDTGANDRCYDIQTSGALMYFYASDDGGWTAGHQMLASESVTAGVNVYWAGIVRGDGEYPELFKNGVDTSTGVLKGPTTINTGATTLELGCARNSGARFRYIDGKVDEVRVSKTDRTPDWIKATYESERDHLLTFGAEEAPLLPPTDLTLTYISDWEVYVNWTKASSANMTMVRVAYGRDAQDRFDGEELYYGVGNNVTLWAQDVGMVGPIHVRAFSQDSEGFWEDTGIMEEGNFMSITWFFAVAYLGGIWLLAMSLSKRPMQFLLNFATMCFWFGLGAWFVISPPFNDFGLPTLLMDVLCYLPVLFGFTIAADMINRWNQTEITREAGGKSWTEYGPKPKTKIANYEDYKAELRRRLGR